MNVEIIITEKPIVSIQVVLLLGMAGISTTLLVTVAAVAFAESDLSEVLITGATGRTGSLLYSQLKAKGATVRAFARSEEKAREYLNCTQCDESEGIYIGNVSDTDALMRAANGVSAVVDCVGVSGSESEDVIKEVEFVGVQNTLAALAQPSNLHSVGLVGLRLVMLSSMGTTQPAPTPAEGGTTLFYKLQAEAFVGASGVPFVIVKPCGLDNRPGGSRTILTGHDDTLLSTLPPLISRADVASVLAAALVYPTTPLRLDLCSKRGPPQPDMRSVLAAARYPWQK